MRRWASTTLTWLDKRRVRRFYTATFGRKRCSSRSPVFAKWLATGRWAWRRENQEEGECRGGGGTAHRSKSSEGGKRSIARPTFTCLGSFSTSASPAKFPSRTIRVSTTP